MASEKADGPLSTRPRLDRRNLRISTVSPEEEDEKSTSGIAGVGAGGTREMVFDVKAFGRMSLPNGFQGEHEPILVKTRPVTYHGEEHEHVLDALEDDFPLGMASLDEIQTAVSSLGIISAILITIDRRFRGRKLPHQGSAISMYRTQRIDPKPLFP